MAVNPVKATGNEFHGVKLARAERTSGLLVSAAEIVDFNARQQKVTFIKQERTHWRHILWEELSHLPNLQYAVVLGSYALEAIVGYESITKARRTVFPIDLQGRRVQVLATYDLEFAR